MTLLVTIFLVLINIFNNVTSNSPNVEGLTAISSNVRVISTYNDNVLSAWIITCILFVFGALAGYAGLLLRKNRLTRSDHINGRCNSVTVSQCHMCDSVTVPSL